MKRKNKCKVEELTLKEIIGDLVAHIVTEEMSEMSRGVQCECSDEEVIGNLIAQCKERGIQSAIVGMNPTELVDVVYANMDKLMKDRDGYVVKPEFSEGLDLLIVADKDIEPGDILIGPISEEEHTNNLVDFICNADKDHLGIKMSVQTLDKVMSVLNSQGKKPLMLEDKVLLPCKGYKMVVIDNTIPFGKVSYTNEV